MANFTFQSVVVTAIDEGDSDTPIAQAHSWALELFERDLVSALTEVGHNCVHSFCVFPTGSGNQREPQLAHSTAIVEFCRRLHELEIDFVALKWTGDIEPHITDAH
jgi:hypothetical protein